MYFTAFAFSFNSGFWERSQPVPRDDSKVFVILNYGPEQVEEPDVIGRLQQYNYSVVIP